jgi:hypothetical protein
VLLDLKILGRQSIQTANTARQIEHLPAMPANEVVMVAPVGRLVAAGYPLSRV